MAANKTAAKKFEYKTTELLKCPGDSFKLKMLGNDGWELVAISHESNYAICYTMFWKKEIFD